MTSYITEAGKLTKNASNAAETVTDTIRAAEKWGKNPFKIAEGVTAEAGAKGMRLLETGGDAAKEAKKAVWEAKAAVGADGIRLSTRAQDVANARKIGFSGADGAKSLKGAKKGGSGPKGHVAIWEHLDGHGQLIDSGVSHSGGTKPGRVLSWEEQLQTHTERKILDELSKKGTVSAGDTIVIYGTKPPCNPGRSMKPSRECQKAMQNFANDNNVNILYFMEGDPNPWIFPR